MSACDTCVAVDCWMPGMPIPVALEPRVTPEERNALRGVVLHMIRPWRADLFRRDRVGPAWTLRKHRPKGTPRCTWCWKPCKPRQSWHPLCLKYFFACRGQTIGSYHRPLVKQTPCRMCGGPATEIDHILALSIAHEMGQRFAVRAFFPSNMQWLCRECHRIKTASDKRLLANLRNPRPIVLERQELLF